MVDVLVVCSPGGHFEEAMSLISGLDDIEYKFVTHLLPNQPESLKGKILVAPHAERDVRLLLQLGYAYSCIRRERPKIIVSTGAAIALPFAIIGKLFGAKVFFFESYTRVIKPSLTARLIYPISDRFYVPYEGLLKYFPRAIWLDK